MRKGFFVVITLLFITMIVTTTGCSSKEGGADSIDSITAPTDTDSMTLSAEDSLVIATPMPKRADELFDDFFFNFYINKNLQLNRITFPLAIADANGERMVSKKEWTMEHFFRFQEFYSVIAGSQKALRNASDTAVSHVVVEKLQLKEGSVRQFVFNRVDGLWKMQRIQDVALDAHSDASFLKFLYRFTSDEAFQEQSLAPSIRYTGPSEVDDETTVTCNITPDQWADRIHAFPDNFEDYAVGEGFFDIVYGNSQPASNTRIVSFRGIANGNEIKYTFSKNGSSWQLVRYEM